MKVIARPWTPQDLLDDLQVIIDEESDEYLNTRRTTLKMALAYLEEHFNEPKWIPTALGFFPEDEGTYLVCSERGSVYATHYYPPKRCSSGYVREGGFTPKGKVKVTYWMPMPKPPKE